MKVQEALQLFANHKLGEGIKEKTIKNYLALAKPFIASLPSERQNIGDILPSDITNFLAHERARGLSPVTVRGMWRTLDLFFGWASSNRELGNPPNPMFLSPDKKIKAPKIPKKEPRRARLSDLQRVIDAIPTNTWPALRDRAILCLLMDTGLRVGEAAALDISDIDIKQRLLLVRAGKGDKDRRVPFTEGTAKALLRYWLAKPVYSGTAVFLSAKGGHTDAVRGRMSVTGIEQMLQRLCKAAGVAHINPHSIRHAFACKAIDDGIRLEVIQKLMGHHDAGFTAKVYAHLSTKAIEKEYNEHWK